MDPVWQAVIWSVIPVALLLLAFALAVYGLRHRQPRQREDPVERAYLDAQAHAARSGPQPEHGATHRLVRVQPMIRKPGSGLSERR